MKNTLTKQEKRDAQLQWKIHTGNILAEIVNANTEGWVLKIPLLTLDSILREVAQRASELHDPELNSLMARLALYDVADPTSLGYDREVVEQIHERAARAKKSKSTERKYKRRKL
jgi:hypothetical protein